MPPGPLRNHCIPRVHRQRLCRVQSADVHRPSVDTCCGGAIIRLAVVAALQPPLSLHFLVPVGLSSDKYAVWPIGFDRPPVSGNTQRSCVDPGDRDRQAGPMRPRRMTEGQSRSPQSVPTLPTGPWNAVIVLNL
ncbi:hypothetical protein C8R44DRAFT_731372 [Mycena epipterygia]|nr:hypothetical protein C8R44DRAFT_731372 [Mycena epipterygia]